MDYKLGFIGIGNMATAIINSVLHDGSYSKKDIYLYDVDVAKCEKFAGDGYQVVGSESDVVTSSNIVFLAVRPSDLKTVLERISQAVSLQNVLVSMAAGISISFLKKTLGKECKVVRIMPNTPVSVGRGATAMAYEMPITYSEVNAVKQIFESSGIVEVLPENKMNEVVSVNGSGPVFVYLLAKAMISGARSQGIDEDVAKRLAVQTIAGATEMLIQSDLDAQALVQEVCSPNGTTEKVVSFLEKRNFEQAIGDSMLACTKRAAELEREAARDAED